MDYNKCIVLLEFEEETKQLINLRNLQGGAGGGWLEFKRWHLDIKAIAMNLLQNHRWIAVRGLPLHLWTLGFLRAIRGLCGGFIRVEVTIRMASCEEARILVRGGSLNKIPCTISIFDRGKEVKVGIFLLESKKLDKRWSAVAASTVPSNRGFKFQMGDRAKSGVQRSSTISRVEIVGESQSSFALNYN